VTLFFGFFDTTGGLDDVGDHPKDDATNCYESLRNHLRRNELMESLWTQGVIFSLAVEIC
jgi:hypothetical protein